MVNSSDNYENSGREAYEFVAFVLWYIAMVLCCIVPTCCSYYRRRRMEAQYFSQQQTSMEMFLREQQQEVAGNNNNNNGDGTREGGTGMNMNNNASNIFFWSSHTGITYYGGITTPTHTMNQVLTLETLEGDVAKLERKKRTEVAIEETSFVIKSGDIVFHDENINLDSSSSNSSNDMHTTKPQKKSPIESKKRCYDDANDNDNINDNDNDNDNEVHSLKGVKDGMKNEEDIEEGINPIPFDIVDNNTVLQLPFSFVTKNNDEDDQQQQTKHTTRRTVPIVCAICLGNYEEGDSITCSPLSIIPSAEHQNQEDETQTQTSSTTTTVVTDGSLSSLSCCPHAFHRDCIVQWLSKRNDARPECPVCRRTFCTVVPITTADLTTLNNSAEGTVVVATTGATETSMETTAAAALSDTNRTLSMSVGQIPMIAVPINNNTSDRVMMILPTRSSNMVAFHGHHHRRTRDNREP